MRFWRTREFGTALVLALMLGACEIASRHHTGTGFLNFEQLGRVLRNCSFVGIAAIGACAVIISGGVDLSAGSVMGLSAVTLAHLFVNVKLPAPLALGAGLLAGTAAGLLNGLCVGKLKLPPFIATLGMLSIARGTSYWITPQSIPLDWEEGPEKFIGFDLLGNNSVWVMVLLGALAVLLMARLRWGRYVYAIGGNEEAARFAGVRIDRTQIGIYAVAGFFSALAGCAYTLRYGSAYVALGQGYELQIIAACAIGGISFSGGQGSVTGALLGAATLQVLRELLIQLRVTDQYIDIAYGGTIILAVAVDQLRQRPFFERWLGRKSK